MLYRTSVLKIAAFTAAVAAATVADAVGFRNPLTIDQEHTTTSGNGAELADATADCKGTINQLRTQYSKVNSVFATPIEGSTQSDNQSDLLSIAEKELKAALGNNPKCDSLNLTSETPLPGILLKVPPSKQATFQCSGFLQESYNAGIEALKKVENYDSSTAKFDTDKVPFNNENVQNLAYLMLTKNKQVGCAKTACATPNPNNLIYCTFGETLTKDDKPFSPALFYALTGRPMPQPPASSAQTLFTAAALFSLISTWFVL